MLAKYIVCSAHKILFSSYNCMMKNIYILGYIPNFIYLHSRAQFLPPGRVTEGDENKEGEC